MNHCPAMTEKERSSELIAGSYWSYEHKFVLHGISRNYSEIEASIGSLFSGVSIKRGTILFLV